MSGKRSWHATGTAAIKPRAFKQQYLKRLLSEIRRNGLEIVEPAELTERVEIILGGYDAAREIGGKGSLAAVRAKIADASKKASALLKSIRALDQDTSDLIDLTEQEYKSFLVGLLKFSAALKIANEKAGKFSNGRPPDIARIMLSAEVAVLFIEIFDKMPTTSKDGPYVTILGIILEAATGKDVSEVHALAAHGVEGAKLLLTNR